MKAETEFVPTPSQTVGPFFAIELTTAEHCVRCIAGPRAKGERIWITFRVLDGDSLPVDDAMIEVWQADSNGKYNDFDDLQSKPIQDGWIGFGRLATGEDGTCVLETIKPGRVGQNAPHVLLAIFARGVMKQLFTRVYFAGDSANDDDPTLAIAPTARRETLLAQPDAGSPGHWRFEIRLQGDPETVFFDV